MSRRTFALTLLLCAAGCLWRSYATIMSVHLDVLTQTANKLCAVVETGKGPSTEGMAEYVYPAQRGREFLNQFSAYSARPSYQQFRAFLDRYEAMVRDVDANRATGNKNTPLAAERDTLQRIAAEIRQELKKES